MAAVQHQNAILTRETPKGAHILVDTNVLIGLCDDKFQFHTPTKTFFERARNERTDVRFLYVMPSRLELFDYFRKVALTRFLRENFATGKSLSGGEGRMDEIARGMTKLRSDSFSDEILSEKEIKKLRVLCLMDHPEGRGIKIWKNIVAVSVAGKLEKTKRILSDYGVRYLNFTDTEVFPNHESKPKWEDQEKLVTEYAAGTADAAILNVALSSARVFGILTNDHDIIEIVRERKNAGLVCFTALKNEVMNGAA